MKKVLISGYYGFGNIGDEAILAAMIVSLRSEIPNIKITVSSNRPGETEQRCNVRAISRSAKEIRHALRTTDLFISGGGGLLQDSTSFRSLLYYCGLLIMARVQRVPAMIYAQGIGPLRRRTSKFLVRLAISGCNVITVRDEQSKQLLRDIGVRREIEVTADPALLLKPSIVEFFEDTKRPIIGFALRSWKGIDIDSVAETADKVSTDLGATPVFIPFHAGRDSAIAQQIMSKMQSESVLAQELDSPVDILALIGELDALVAMRLHSMIFAALQGVPFLPVTYDPKVSTFAQNIGVDNGVVIEQLVATELMPRIRDLIDAGQNSNNIDELKMHARRNAELAKHLLKERKVIGIRFDALEMDEAADVIETYIHQGKPHLVVTLNAEMMVMARDDVRFREVISKAHLLIPDSIGIVWAGKLRARVPGIDMIDELAKRSSKKGYKIYMVGSKEGVARKAGDELRKRYPGLKIVGMKSGYFSLSEEKSLINDIREAEPDILLVGFGMGRQEKWIYNHLFELGVPACLGVGGSFDVIAGDVQRAPEWIRNAGLEWLYRFAQQPTRLKRALALPKFVYMVMRERGIM